MEAMMEVDGRRRIGALHRLAKFSACTLLAACATAGTAFADDANDDYTGWNVGLGGGMLFFEADEEYEPTQVYELRAGYDFHPNWTAEGAFGYMPFMNNTNFDPPASSPENDRFEVNDESWGFRLNGDLLYHIYEPQEREFDPFLAVTGGVNYSDQKLENDQHFDPFGGLGFGAAYDVADNWYARGDYRFLVTGHDTEYNHLAMLSLGYRWGSRDTSGADKDSDASRMDRMDKEGRTLVTIYFAFDSAALTEAAKGKLRENADYLKANPNVRIVIEGHCDERGTNEYNMALGQRRAASAFEYLRTLGIPAERMNPISYGEERPADPRSNEEAWAKNRRAECKVAQ